jgi:hypothetical protein
MQMQNIQKLSPPFEGGVAGTIDYLPFTKLISRPGWLMCALNETDQKSESML